MWCTIVKSHIIIVPPSTFFCSSSTPNYSIVFSHPIHLSLQSPSSHWTRAKSCHRRRGRRRRSGEWWDISRELASCVLKPTRSEHNFSRVLRPRRASTACLRLARRDMAHCIADFLQRSRLRLDTVISAPLEGLLIAGCWLVVVNSSDDVLARYWKDFVAFVFLYCVYFHCFFFITTGWIIVFGFVLVLVLFLFSVQSFLFVFCLMDNWHSSGSLLISLSLSLNSSCVPSSVQISCR